MEIIGPQSNNFFFREVRVRLHNNATGENETIFFRFGLLFARWRLKTVVVSVRNVFWLWACGCSGSVVVVKGGGGRSVCVFCVCVCVCVCVGV